MRMLKKIVSNPKHQTTNIPILEGDTALFDQAFEGFDFEKDFYKLYIDKDRQSEGPLTFDKKEPGYGEGMKNGFRHVRETLNIPINLDPKKSLEILSSYHDACVKNVFKFDGLDNKVPFQLGTHHTTKSHYGIDREKVSETALDEWDSEKIIIGLFDIAQKSPGHDLYCGYFIPSSYTLQISGRYNLKDSEKKGPITDEDEIKHLEQKKNTQLNRILKEYDTSIQSATSDHEKLKAIALCLMKIEVSHFFIDGNQRMVAFALCNKFMIENGFGPVILEDPFIFDGFKSSAEIVEDLKQGMENYKESLGLQL